MKYTHETDRQKKKNLFFENMYMCLLAVTFGIFPFVYCFFFKMTAMLEWILFFIVFTLSFVIFYENMPLEEGRLHAKHNKLFTRI